MSKENKVRQKADRPMTDVTLSRRGKAVDELQERIASLQKTGQSVPDEYRSNLRKLAETTDADAVDEVTDWMATTLPPKKYATAEITWATFKHFSSSFMTRLAISINVYDALGMKDEVEKVRELIKEVYAIDKAAATPVIALAELTRLETDAEKTLVLLVGEA